MNNKAHFRTTRVSKWSGVGRTRCLRSSKRQFLQPRKRTINSHASTVARTAASASSIVIAVQATCGVSSPGSLSVLT
ncbi:hypothetical protein BDV98DRAFT_311299 [Pterulicium gracile]|uniref:Uncharacterized protein n=1 Tax=Pterulicium gracile TaxID=1884261 RepID=A0A5C3Q3D8_9AGAR|nr:hypothetical protein BDV98DRAFT_311299 [Pterula gracilis]